jgi:hypothetical protein
MGPWWLFFPMTVVPQAAIDAGPTVDAQAADSASSAASDGSAPALDGGASPLLDAAAAPRPVVPSAGRSEVPGAASARAAPAKRPARRPGAGRPRPAPGLCIAQETAHYRVTFGLLGQVAEATLSLTPDAVSGPLPVPPVRLRLAGVGSGNVLGFGQTEKRVDADFDARALLAPRWSSVRTTNGKTTADAAEQAQPGTVALLRKRSGEKDLAESFRRTATVLDPLSFLLRLRLAPPAAASVYEVLDGRALWLATVSAARIDRDRPELLRVDGRFDPIYWSGGTDKERRSYDFSLFVTRDRNRTPVRLLVPFGLGEVRAELVQVERHTGGRTAGSGLACEEPGHRSFWQGMASALLKDLHADLAPGRADR